MAKQKTNQLLRNELTDAINTGLQLGHWHQQRHQVRQTVLLGRAEQHRRRGVLQVHFVLKARKYHVTARAQHTVAGAVPQRIGTLALCRHGALTQQQHVPHLGEEVAGARRRVLFGFTGARGAGFALV